MPAIPQEGAGELDTLRVDGDDAVGDVVRVDGTATVAPFRRDGRTGQR